MNVFSSLVVQRAAAVLAWASFAGMALSVAVLFVLVAVDLLPQALAYLEGLADRQTSPQIRWFILNFGGVAVVAGFLWAWWRFFRMGSEMSLPRWPRPRQIYEEDLA